MPRTGCWNAAGGRKHRSRNGLRRTHRCCTGVAKQEHENECSADAARGQPDRHTRRLEAAHQAWRCGQRRRHAEIPPTRPMPRPGRSHAARSKAALPPPGHGEATRLLLGHGRRTDAAHRLLARNRHTDAAPEPLYRYGTSSNSGGTSGREVRRMPGSAEPNVTPTAAGAERTVRPQLVGKPTLPPAGRLQWDHRGDTQPLDCAQPQPLAGNAQPQPAQ